MRIHFRFLCIFVIAIPINASVLNIMNVYERSIGLEKTDMAKKQVEVADSQYKQAIRLILPPISISGQWMQQKNHPQTGISSTTSSNQYLALNSSLTLFQGLREFYALDSAKSDQKLAREQLASTRIQVLSALAQAATSLMELKEEIHLLQESVQTTSKRLEEIKKWWKIGRSPERDYLATLSQFNSIEAQLAGSQTRYESQWAQFKINYALEHGEELHQGRENLTLLPLQNYLETIPQNPDQLAALAQEESATSAIGVARADYFPQVSVNGNYYAYSKPSSGPKPEWSVGLNLNFPIFQWGATKENVASAKVKKIIAEKNTQLIRRNLTAQIEQLYASLKLGIQEEKALLAAVNNQQKQYSVVQKDFRNSLVTNLDVLQSLNQLITNQMALANVIWSNQFNFLLLKIITNKL